MLDNLNNYQILLASKSPRRRELLEELRIPFRTVTICGIEERYPAELPPEEVAEYLARLKASAYRKIIKEDELIITADTVVLCGSEILGKPKNSSEAIDMLRKLSGRSHRVLTGVTVMTSQRMESFTSSTEVKFVELSDEEIVYYVERFQPLDKAGSYGIQEWIGCVAVESISGSYFNVMGLPVHALYKLLSTF